MNFLLHHEFALAELTLGEASAVASVGAMLPDLWRMADRRVRPRALVTSDARSAEEPAPLRALLEGIDHHVRIDRWFHRSAGFASGERDLRARFFETKSPKLLLFAHAAWEMCLDGALIRERGLASVAERLRQGLDQAMPHFARAAAIHHFDEALRDENDRRRFDERMLRIAAAGKGGALYEDYVSADGIARRLAGMRLAFGFESPREGELGTWARALDAAQASADTALPRLREERAVFIESEPRASGSS